MALNRYITVSISTVSPSITRTSFSKALLVAYHTYNTDAYRTYTDPTEMVTDGFSTNEPAYLAAKSYFDQENRPPELVVARLTAAPTFTWTFTVSSASPGDSASLTVRNLDGTETVATTTAAALEDETDIATGIASTINALTDYSASAVGAVVTITPATAKQQHPYAPVGGSLLETTADANYDDLLGALETAGLDFYYIAIDSFSEANTELVAAWAGADGTRKKWYMAGLFGSDVVGGTAAWLATMVTSGVTSTLPIWSHVPMQFLHMAVMADIAGRDPGTWELRQGVKQLVNITPSTFSTTQLTNLDGYNTSFYVRQSGVNIMDGGKALDGEWADVEIGIDAWAVRVQEDLFAHRLTVPKIPFTPSSLEALKAVCNASSAVFAPEPGLLVLDSIKTTIPEASAIPELEKRNRRLSGAYGPLISARLQGAINFIGVRGVVTYA